MNNEEKYKVINFIKKVKDYLVTEAVYLVCRVNDHKKYLDIVVVSNCSLNYRKKMDISFEKDSYDRKELREYIENLNVQKDEYIEHIEYSDINIRYIYADSDNYNIFLMHKREMFAAKDLVSSTIIFDRFNKFRELKDELKFKYNIEPFTNSFPVDGDIILFMEKKGFSRNLNI